MRTASIPEEKIIVSTICCRKKDPAPGLITASRRYLSDRIRSVLQLARKAGLEFVILSGRFGLIHPEEPIPYYDKLLREDEAEEMSGRVADLLRKEKVGKVIFLIPDPELDPHVRPYLNSMGKGARMANAALEVITVPPYPENLAPNGATDTS